MFNAAVLTMPIPQILQLPGMKEIIDSETSEKLSKVQYSSRYALALFFDTYEEKISLDTDPKIHHQTSAEYISDDPIFCYAAIDNVKRGFEDINHPTSVVFHTNVPWGIKNLEVPLPEIEKILLKHFKDRYPNWPEPKSLLSFYLSLVKGLPPVSHECVTGPKYIREGGLRKVPTTLQVE